MLEAVIDHAPVSRSKLVEITGLSKPTVLAIVTTLREQRLIRPVASTSTGAGRPADWYEANPRAGFAIGVDLGGTKVRAALCDLVGHVVDEMVEPTDPTGGEAVVAQLVRMSKTLAKRSRVAWRSVRSMAVGCPGYVTDDGTLTAAVNIAGFDRFPLRRLLEQATRLEVVVDNDVNVAAFGEFASGGFGPSRNLVVISVGTGIGAGVVIDGQVIRGAHGAAGEVAYLPLGADPTTAKARRHGSLELAASGPAMQRALRAAFAAPGIRPATELTPGATPADILAASERGDSLAAELVQAEAELIARAVLSVSVVCDPDVVVLAGGLGANPLLLQPVRDAVAEMAPIPIRVERSLLGERSGVVGAISLARERAWQLLFAPVDLRRSQELPT